MKEYMRISTTYPLWYLNASLLVALFKLVNLFYEKNMSDYWIKVNRKLTDFGGRLTVSGNNQNNIALVETLVFVPQTNLLWV